MKKKALKVVLAILLCWGFFVASIYTYNAGLKTRLEKFSREYPQFCRLKEKNRYGGRMYLVDKTRLSIHLQPPYSEKRIETVTRNLLKSADDTDE